MELNSFFTFAIFGGLAAVAPILTPVAFGEQWRSAGPLLQLWAFHALILGLFVYCSPALLAAGGSSRFIINGIIAAMGAVVACAIGAITSIEVLIALSITNIALTGILSLAFLERMIGLSPWKYLSACVRPAGAALLMFVAVRLIASHMPSDSSALAALLLECVAGAAVYLLVCSVLLPKQRGEMLALLHQWRRGTPEPLLG